MYNILTNILLFVLIIVVITCFVYVTNNEKQTEYILYDNNLKLYNENQFIRNISAPPPTIHIIAQENYKQIGILVKNNTDKYPVILPLLCRRLNRYKYQYYTYNNSGNLNIRKKESGKIYNDEYGTNELYDKDIVYVDGFQQYFTITV